MSQADQPNSSDLLPPAENPSAGEQKSGFQRQDPRHAVEQELNEFDLSDVPDPVPSTDLGATTDPALVEVMGTLSQPARLEAILYLKGRPMSLGELASLSGMEREDVELALITLMTDYAHRDTALEIFQDGQTYSLQLRQGLNDLVQVLLPVDLSTAALRTLATIALKKRILQSDLVELRGSGAYDHIKELLAQNFIERKRQSEGRSYWLTLSEKFHRTFAIAQQTEPLQRVAGSADADSAA
jgi:segregation and condensation protein B